MKEKIKVVLKFFFTILYIWFSTLTLSDLLPVCLVRRETQCQCGRTTRETKIVGGAKAERNEYPWQGKTNLILTSFYSLSDNFQFASLYPNTCVEDLSSAETRSSQPLTALRVSRLYYSSSFRFV